MTTARFCTGCNPASSLVGGFLRGDVVSSCLFSGFTLRTGECKFCEADKRLIGSSASSEETTALRRVDGATARGRASLMGEPRLRLEGDLDISFLGDRLYAVDFLLGAANDRSP